MVKIHWRMLILVFTRRLRSKNLTWWHWPLTLKTNKVPNSHKDKVCTKFGQNPLKDVDSRVCTRMLCGKHLTPWPLTLKINRVPDSPKDYVCTKFGQNPLKDVDPRVFTRMWRTDGSVTISLRNFVDEGITNCKILKCCKILSITWTINVIENHDVIWNFWT